MKHLNKEFDCIEMKRRIQAEIFEETKDMTHEEFSKYLVDQIKNSQFAWFLDKPLSPFVSKTD